VRTGPELRSESLLLRRWRPDDLEPFAALNADATVMEHFPSTLSRSESNAFIQRMEAGFEAHGYSFWALELIEQERFIGFVGLRPVGREMPFGPTVEIGWRLARAEWGHGFATEAAGACVRFAFDELGLPALVAFTAARNWRSRRVMERLGMTRDPSDDFSHPKLAPGHALAAHVLYRLTPAR